MNPFASTILTVLQWGGYLVVLLLACGIVSSSVRHVIKGYYEYKVAYVARLAQLQAETEPPDMTEIYAGIHQGKDGS